MAHTNTKQSSAVPVRITVRAPTRSTNRPTSGALNACARLNPVKASEIAPRPARNSWLSGLKYTLNENTTIGAAPNNSPNAAVATHHHP